MPGTSAGSKKAAKTMRQRYGDNYFTQIGRIGGSAGVSGGFASLEVGSDGLTGPERARIAGRKGGMISRRGAAKKQGERLKVATNESKVEHGN